MSCERYQKALTALAATAAEPRGDLRAHLNACPVCRAFLEEEQLLLASIDAGVRPAANAEPPASFRRGVEMRLAQEATPKRIELLRWAHVAAVAAGLLLLLVSALRLRNTEQPIASQEIRGSSSQQNPVQTQALPPSVTKKSGVSRTAQHHSVQKAQSAKNESLEVLVPTEEREAFAKFAQDVVEHREVGTAMVNPAPERKAEPLKVEPLQIARLEIKRLAEESAPTGTELQAE